MRTSIAVVFNNGQRQKLVPGAAHKIITRGWGSIPAEDQESQEAYLAWCEEEGFTPAGVEAPGEEPAEPELTKPPDEEPDEAPAEEPGLPPGYTVEKRGGYHVALLDGVKVGTGKRSPEEAAEEARRHHDTMTG